MSTTARQTNLLVQRDWTKVYQTFTNADFTSYDFETLRNTMINYLKTYYPEDYNDFIESSEFIALIDMLAFLGQSLAFRTDLNARENYIDTAQRRDSILKLARMLSYNPQRNTGANGFIKIDNIRTTESVVDSNGINLANQIINWNDIANDNWLEQFTAVINAALLDNQMVGKPGNSQIINGIQTDEYGISLVPNVLPIVPFQATVNGSAYRFEAVSATSAGQQYIYEADPTTSGKFNILYKNDNNGNGSVNTGFFLYFKQGTMTTSDFSIVNAIPNNFVSINTNNINNNDSWLYTLNVNNNPSTLWSQVPAIAGLNIVYNQQSQKNLYQVNTRDKDQVDLVFGDGSFANIPQGKFRYFFRTTNGLNYTITPDDMKSVVISFNYISKTNAIETLTFTASLKYSVANATATQSLTNIKTMAPQQYYTQNRMITAEDYNIFPLTSFNSIQKIKAINRTSSGVSLYLDSLDPTGSYSGTNLFGDDGALYTQSFIQTFTFDFLTSNDVYNVIYDEVVPKIVSKEMLHFYYANYPRYTQANITFTQASETTSSSTGYLYNGAAQQQVGSGVSNNLKYIATGSLLKFTAPSGKFFDNQNNLETGSGNTTLYAPVVSALNNSQPINSNNNLLSLATSIPTGSVLSSIIAPYTNTLPNSLVLQMVAQIQSYNTFGLRYDQTAMTWKIITSQNLASTSSAFSLTNAGDTSGQGLDSSWLISFNYVNGLYTVSYRGLNYVFQSAGQTTFYFNPDVKVYNSVTGSTVTDNIKVLKINSQSDSASPLGTDFNWQVYNTITQSDGYVDPDKILVTFPSTMMENIPDNPDFFTNIVNPTVNPNNKLVFFQATNSGYSNFINYNLYNSSSVSTQYPTGTAITGNVSLFNNGQVFYAYNEGNVYVLNNGTVSTTSNIIAQTGRDNLYFQYKHNAPARSRIDPTPVNLIDVYVLTANYATDYIAWVQDTTGTLTEPTLPTADSLQLAYQNLDNYKSMGDSLIFSPARFKPLFGPKADSTLRARFKVVPGAGANITDYEIKTSVIAAINNYFNINNWDFGEPFYFSELAAYLHSALAPNISSVLIVPTDTSVVFGNYFQINAQPWEIITSAATVNDIDVITAITAAQLNLSLAALNGNNNNTLIGTY
jgi:hypothetical protein